MNHKKVLFVNLTEQKSELKSMPDLDKYVGGVGVGLKLLLENRKLAPLIFSVGPLNGFFPYASKTSVVFQNGGNVEDAYLGGSLSHKIRYAGLDSIVIFGQSKKPTYINIIDGEVSFLELGIDIHDYGLPGKKCILSFDEDTLLLDGYFKSKDQLIDTEFFNKQIAGLIVTGSNTFNVKEHEKFYRLYKKILTKTDEMNVKMSGYLSCSGCPMGCSKSAEGEIGGNVLVHSLVGCQFAERIYSDVGTIFSCLNILGYDYTHEDIENLPFLIKEVLKELS